MKLPLRSKFAQALVISVFCFTASNLEATERDEMTYEARTNSIVMNDAHTAIEAALKHWKKHNNTKMSLKDFLAQTNLTCILCNKHLLDNFSVVEKYSLSDKEVVKLLNDMYDDLEEKCGSSWKRTALDYVPTTRVELADIQYEKPTAAKQYEVIRYAWLCSNKASELEDFFAYPQKALILCESRLKYYSKDYSSIVCYYSIAELFKLSDQEVIKILKTDSWDKWSNKWFK